MSEKQKWMKTMEVYDEYERRFAMARANKKMRNPADKRVRQEIIEETKRMLGFRDELVPKLHNVEEIYCERFDTYDVTQLRYETWENFYGSASVYMPHGNEKVPMVFLSCGHGVGGRLSKGYVAMGHRLAKMGMAVVIPDNIGQGDRERQGHRHCVAPFYCGLTVQGLIVMEMLAVIRYMKECPRVDKNRLGACGNSGGGTLNLFLAALAPELSALSASGYPSEFSYVLSKERRHCTCNWLPGCVGGLEMWEILSCFAPKPLFLEQGLNDDLLPVDLMQRCVRKVKNVYIQMDAADHFDYAITKTLHAWTPEDRYRIAQFLADQLQAAPAVAGDDEFEELLARTENWHVENPADSLDIEQLAQKLTGITMPEGTVQWDVFKPMYQGEVLKEEEIMSDLGRGQMMKILAQMECALKTDWNVRDMH